MQTGNLSKPFSVDVFSDRKPLNGSPWLRVGEFDEVGEAVEACKKVVDEFLTKQRPKLKSVEDLQFEYLNYGPVPCIIGAKNPQIFEFYEYLNRRCIELGQQ